MIADVVRDLWGAVWVLAAAGGLGLAVMTRRREGVARRRRAALLGVEREPFRQRVDLIPSARRWGPPIGALICGCLLVGGPAGWMVGVAGACGVRRWLKGRQPEGDDRTEEVTRQLPLAADLLAACVAAGAGPREAAEAVGESLGGVVGERLARTAAEIRLGGEPAEAWGRLADIPGAAGLARCLERAARTGAPAADPVARLAEGFRAERSRAATTRAHRAQVLITAPVGLCFLPAFLAVGVAPVVIGLAGGLLNGS